MIHSKQSNVFQVKSFIQRADYYLHYSNMADDANSDSGAGSSSVLGMEIGGIRGGGKKNGGMSSGGREKGFKMEVKGGRGRVIRGDPP